MSRRVTMAACAAWLGLAAPAAAQGLDHLDHLWLSGQVNVIAQHHPAFPAPYSGDHSFRPVAEQTTSVVLTLFTGVRIGDGTEVLFDVESAGGRGLSDALGLAGFTDLDVVRNPSLGSRPYVARVMLHQTIALGPDRVAVDPTPLSLARSVPVRRIEIRVGKLGTADVFDLNTAGSDSHLQFMNWTVDNSGAYDYAADTRGYTWGAVAEYHAPGWALRFGEMLMPTVANGIDLDWDLGRARAENLELELRTPAVAGREGAVRLLAYANHANMGDYRQAVQRFQAGLDPQPMIENTRRQGRIKYGFGVNAEQPVTSDVRVFGRAGWNEPHFESFAYTEVNETIEAGAEWIGARWKRPRDKIGGVLVSNGISADHQRYLALGGSGFLLGDGALRYGREQIVESYYNAHVWRGVSFAGDVQRIVNPGYNRDRGPVLVTSLRLHIEL